MSRSSTRQESKEENTRHAQKEPISKEKRNDPKDNGFTTGQLAGEKRQGFAKAPQGNGFTTRQQTGETRKAFTTGHEKAGGARQGFAKAQKGNGFTNGHETSETRKGFTTGRRGSGSNQNWGVKRGGEHG